MRTLHALAVSAAFIAAPAFAASSVVGSWNTVASTPQGDFAATITVTESGDGYTVEIDDGDMFGPSEISDVVVEEDSFSFIRTLDFGQGPMKISYSAAVDGDTLTGEATSDFGPTPITGERE